MSHNVLRSFMSDLLDADSSVSIMEDNARTCGPLRTRVRRTHSDSSAAADGHSSVDDLPSRRRFSDCGSSSSNINNKKRLSRWEAFEEKGGLVTPKRCHSPMRLPLRSLAHHMEFDFGGVSASSAIDASNKSDSSLCSTLNLVDEAISVCAQVNSSV